jgi:hypothetical protein
MDSGICGVVFSVSLPVDLGRVAPENVLKCPKPLVSQFVPVAQEKGAA